MTADCGYGETFVFHAEPKALQRPPTAPLFPVQPNILDNLLYNPKIVAGVEHAIKYTSKGMTIVAIGVDTQKIVTQIANDMETGDFKGSLVTSAGVAGGWTAAYGGGKAGLNLSKMLPAGVPPLVRVIISAGLTMSGSYFAYEYGTDVAEQMLEDFLDFKIDSDKKGSALIFDSPFEFLLEQMK